jgi:DNA-binding beta-propeller fold protein YncE
VSNNLERVLIRVDNDGNLLEKTILSDYDFQAGMIDMSPDMQNLMIKPNDRSWILELNKLTKNQIRQVSVLSSAEGLGVDYANNEVWVGDNGTLYKYDYDTFALLSTHPFQTLPNGASQNVEGIIIDPIDRAVIIVADAYLHGANNNGNAMWVFDFNKTIGKNVRFPQMMQFQGKFSYVIDFGSVNDLIQATIEEGSGNIYYRGSNTAPTFPAVQRTNWRDRPYYADWGDTIPSEWSLNMPDFRYMQLKVE